MGRPVSCEENLMSSSTREKSCFAWSGVMWVSGWGLSLLEGVEGAWVDGVVCEAAGWAGAADCRAAAETGAEAAARHRTTDGIQIHRTFSANSDCVLIQSPCN